MPAIRTGQSVKWALWKLAGPSWTVKVCGEEVTTGGRRKSFQTDRNVRIATVHSGGPMSGSRILVSTRK
nr:hypothetical protein [Nakamurella sp. PAMC28650]